MVTYEEIAAMIDHSLLKPTLTDQDIIDGCNLAKEYKVASVCVRPSDLPLCRKILAGSDVLLTTVIGFPHGTTTTKTKVAESAEAIENGAVELDVVLNIGKLRSGEYDYVADDLQAVINLAHANNVLVKVIFENCYLSREEIIKACEICNKVGADYVKTSTGYGTGGATDEDLKLMRQYAAPNIKIKAAGGVRTLERAIEVRKLGVTRFGCTATCGILERLK
ncbi:MAG TPA: deoxyribose-phosphate aldolase [Candidatus Aphodoplasma excrementigallinarum]|uniref:Deoxyribose-phosphate aldolase n=1 Tax=Candidatus Aphodoplasma excrementigallinarum TaxID=2840673 RepID=A0A9D1NJ15_9FIRM|nr:deoxyribose-phosphate aldolase [Candidatus Aphodoplasma excrementigallinarum]